jgi:DNA-binding response OmpR family regulator
MPTAHILIAEDDPVLRSLYEKKFIIEGYTVKTASDGEEATTLLQASDAGYDLVLLDINMPKKDGLQVLKDFPKGKRNFPVIMLTNFDQGEFKLKAFESGADDYFVKKDMTMRTLVDMVRRLLKR